MSEVNQVVEAVATATTGASTSSETSPVPAAPKKYATTIYPGPRTEISRDFAEKVLSLQTLLGMPLWLVVQNALGNWGDIDEILLDGIYKRRDEIPAGTPVALLIESWGGDAHAAYKIARIFQRRCSPLTAIIPNHAKSAATLLALGASTFVFGKDAELGPLDVQMYESQREEYGSALNAVQSLERINAFSMNAIDQMAPMLIRRTGKKLDMILPLVLDYMTNLVRPLLEKIDTLDFTKKSRELKVAEEYAVRLMKPYYRIETAERIARALVENYPAHEFAIDSEESTAFKQLGTRTFGLGLKAATISGEAATALEALASCIPQVNVIGQVVEMQS